MLELATLTPEALDRSSLVDVAALLMAPHPAEFRAAVERLDPSAVAVEVDEAERAFGWKMPGQLRSYLLIEKALEVAAEKTGSELRFWFADDRTLKVILPAASSVKMFGTPQAFLSRLSLELLTGMVEWGENADSDRVYLGTLPDPLDLLTSHNLSHDFGRTVKEGTLKGSLLRIFTTSSEPEAGGPPGAVGEERDRKLYQVSVAHDAQVSKSRELAGGQRLRSAKLDQRSSWLRSLLFGVQELQPTLLADAPTLADWDRERRELSTNPVLSNYWALAHLVLGNEAAMAEALAVADASPAVFTRIVAGTVRQLAQAPAVSTVGSDHPRVLRELRSALARITGAEHRVGT